MSGTNPKLLKPNSRKPKPSQPVRKQFDILSEDYTKLMQHSYQRMTTRDHLIASIMESDRIEKEMIRRAILVDNRLDVLMKLLGYYVRPHHQLFIDFITGLRERGVNSGIVLAPRGSGKSTVLDICYGTMRSLQNRNINILISSRTMEQAQAFLGAIKSCLEKPQMGEVFGELKGDKWDETAADIAGRDSVNKEHTFHVAGADGAVVSKHFDIIIPDDLVEEKNSKTEGQRDVMKKFYYKQLLPTLRPGGEMWVLGTRYHPEDIYGHFLDKDPFFKDSSLVLPGVFDTKTGEPVDLVQNEDGTFALPEGASIWDEEGFPLKELLIRRQGMNHGDFEAQYQNRIEFLRGDYFQSEWFQYYSEEPSSLVKSHNLRVWAGVDLASSQKNSADEFAIVIVGIVPQTFDIYVLDYVSGHYTFNQQKRLLVDMFNIWEPIRTFVEANAYQLVLQATVAEEFPDVRVTPIFTTQDKITRAQAFQTYYERRKVYHRKNRSHKLESQLTGFPHIKLKDLFDAEYIAVWGAMRGGRRRPERREEPGLFGG